MSSRSFRGGDNLQRWWLNVSHIQDTYQCWYWYSFYSYLNSLYRELSEMNWSLT